MEELLNKQKEELINFIENEKNKNTKCDNYLNIDDINDIVCHEFIIKNQDIDCIKLKHNLIECENSNKNHIKSFENSLIEYSILPIPRLKEFENLLKKIIPDIILYIPKTSFLLYNFRRGGQENSSPINYIYVYTNYNFYFKCKTTKNKHTGYGNRCRNDNEFTIYYYNNKINKRIIYEESGGELTIHNNSDYIGKTINTQIIKDTLLPYHKFLNPKIILDNLIDKDDEYVLNYFMKVDNYIIDNLKIKEKEMKKEKNESDEIIDNLDKKIIKYKKIMLIHEEKMKEKELECKNIIEKYENNIKNVKEKYENEVEKIKEENKKELELLKIKIEQKNENKINDLEEENVRLIEKINKLSVENKKTSNKLSDLEKMYDNLCNK